MVYLLQGMLVRTHDRCGKEDREREGERERERDREREEIHRERETEREVHFLESYVVPEV